MRVGAIDIGSNSIRLLVADVQDGDPASPLVTVARAGEACRLARDLHRTGRIDPKLAERGAHIVTDFATRARSLGASRIVAGATAALRGAENGGEVAALISGRSGVPVRILTGDEEARMVYSSVTAGLGGSTRHSACVVFDIGGGSTEVVSGVGSRPGRWTSLPFGAVSLTERFMAGAAGPEQIASVHAHARDLIMHECASMPRSTPVLAGVGGTVTVLAMADRKLTSYEPHLLEGWRIGAVQLDELITRLTATTEAERRTWPAMGEGRADIVIAGAQVVRALCDRFVADALTCSTQGLRYGLARLAAGDPELAADGSLPH
jgi:exopolyphosphatase / guanosine-5'-triphosphate,3'-diphosphate pyrophosphatase